MLDTASISSSLESVKARGKILIRDPLPLA